MAHCREDEGLGGDISGPQDAEPESSSIFCHGLRVVRLSASRVCMSISDEERETEPDSSS
jgi:hypothetical protein